MGREIISSGKMNKESETSSFFSFLSPSSLIIFAWNTFNRFTFLSILFVLICWSAAFIYLTFYFLYVPTLTHHRDVNFQFDHKCERKCLNPSAFIPLYDYKTPSIFVRGQSYDFHIELELPESDVNWNQGMFMVRMQLVDDKQQSVVNYATSTILKYKSYILRLANLVFYWPLYITGLASEKQHLSIPLKTDFIDSINHKHGLAMFANISLEGKLIKFYRCT